MKETSTTPRVIILIEKPNGYDQKELLICISELLKDKKIGAEFRASDAPANAVVFEKIEDMLARVFKLSEEEDPSALYLSAFPAMVAMQTKAGVSKNAPVVFVAYRARGVHLNVAISIRGDDPPEPAIYEALMSETEEMVTRFEDRVIENEREVTYCRTIVKELSHALHGFLRLSSEWQRRTKMN